MLQDGTLVYMDHTSQVTFMHETCFVVQSDSTAQKTARLTSSMKVPISSGFAGRGRYSGAGIKVGATSLRNTSGRLSRPLCKTLRSQSYWGGRLTNQDEIIIYIHICLFGGHKKATPTHLIILSTTLFIIIVNIVTDIIIDQGLFLLRASSSFKEQKQQQDQHCKERACNRAYHTYAKNSYYQYLRMFIPLNYLGFIQSSCLFSINCVWW